MRILIVADPLDGFKTYKDSTFAMMTEAAGRGHALFACLQEDLVLVAGQVHARASTVTLTPGGAIFPQDVHRGWTSSGGRSGWVQHVILHDRRITACLASTSPTARRGCS